MGPIYLLDLASRKTAWLAARQTVVASNVANANTPGFRPKDVVPFKDVLAQTHLTLTSTNGSHIEPNGNDSSESTRSAEAVDNFDATESGNEVNVEDEMTRAGTISREYALTTNIMKTFHAMLMSSVKE